MKISVIGLGKAGLPLAAVIADSGIEVVGVDVDKKRVQEINKGINPIKEETGLGDLIKKHGGRALTATSDYNKAAKECNVFIVIVPLFIDSSHKPDFSILKTAFENISKGLKNTAVSRIKFGVYIHRWTKSEEAAQTARIQSNKPKNYNGL